MTPKERFEKKVRKLISKCWEWTGAVFSNGYGAFRFNGKAINAHRAAFMIYRGAIPAEMQVCHSCDNTLCVNPSHLWLGTRADNMRDMVKKNRHFSPNQRGENHSHAKLTNADVVEIRSIGSSITQRMIARKFNVSQRTIWSVLHHQLWQ